MTSKVRDGSWAIAGLILIAFAIYNASNPVSGACGGIGGILIGQWLARWRGHIASHVCESCGAPFWLGADQLSDYLCTCGLTLCGTCTVVFDHFGKGLHSSGNPDDCVETLRLAQAENRAARIGAKVRELYR